MLQIERNAQGDIIAEKIITKAQNDALVGAASTNNIVPERSEFATELQKIYITTGNIMYLEEQAKLNGINLENDVQYKNNVRILNDAIQKLNNIQLKNLVHEQPQPNAYGLYYVPENQRTELRGVFKGIFFYILQNEVFQY